jgi:hypothetical protein
LLKQQLKEKLKSIEKPAVDKSSLKNEAAYAAQKVSYTDFDKSEQSNLDQSS